MVDCIGELRAREVVSQWMHTTTSDWQFGTPSAQGHGEESRAMWSWMKARVIDPPRTIVNNWVENEGMLLSAAMAYYGALSLYPLLLVLIAGMGWLSAVIPEFQLRRQELLEVVAQNASPWVAEQLRQILADVEAQAAIGGPVGLVTLIITAALVFTQVDAVFAHIWKTPDAGAKGFIAAIRSVLIDRFTAFLMLLCLGLFILVVWVVNLALGGVVTYFEQFAGEGAWLRWIQFGVSFLLNALLFTVAYKVLPRAWVPWRAAVMGGLFTAVVWQIGLRLLEMMVIARSYTAYGVVGSFLAIIVWMFYASAVFTMGAQVVHHNAHGKSED